MKSTTNLAGRALGNGGRSLRSELFERVLNRIHAYFVRLLWDPHAVDDCLQNTLLRLETSLQEGRYKPQHSFNRWMWMKAHAVYVEFCRKQARQPRMVELAGQGRESPELARVEAQLDSATLLARLRSNLKPETFEVLVLYGQEGMSLCDIAALQSCHTRTVRRRLRDAESLAAGYASGD